MNKDRIAYFFSKSSSSYDQWAFPQQRAIKNLIHLCWSPWLHIRGKILDAGCGTGFLSRYLLEMDPLLNIWGLDFSEKNLQYYQVFNKNCIYGDLEKLCLLEDSFEHCFSSFVLHWTDLNKSIPELLRICKKTLTLAIPIHGSRLLGFPFPSQERIIFLLKEGGFFIEFTSCQKLAIPYRGLDFIKYFHYTGTSMLESPKSLKGKGFFKDLVHRCKEQDFYYFVLYLKGIKCH